MFLDHCEQVHIQGRKPKNTLDIGVLMILSNPLLWLSSNSTYVLLALLDGRIVFTIIVLQSIIHLKWSQVTVAPNFDTSIHKYFCFQTKSNHQNEKKLQKMCFETLFLLTMLTKLCKMFRISNRLIFFIINPNKKNIFVYVNFSGYKEGTCERRIFAINKF